MTAGTVTKNTSYGNYSSRTWNGSDGKYFIAAGRKIEKWNNYTMTEYNHTCTASTVKIGNTIYHYEINVGTAGGTTDTDLPGYADVKLQSKLVSKVRGHDFNLGVAAAQMDLTANMAVDTISNLARAIKEVKHGQLGNAARLLTGNPGRHKNSKSVRPLEPSDISSRWLELQYGWLPLISDVQSAADMLHERTSGPRTNIIHTSQTVSRSYNGSASPINYTGYGTYTITKHLWYKMTEQLSNQRSLGLTHPLSIAWEVMPYSFVIDWFLPIGSYLDNLAVIPSLNGEKMTMIVRKWDNVGVGVTKNYAGASANFTKCQVTRTIGSINLATPSFKSLSQAASGKHIANAVALAHQFIASKR